MRAFVALLLPEDITADLEAHLEPRRSAQGSGPDRSGFRWSEPAQWHVTLAFIPDLKEHREERLIDELAGQLVGHPALRLRLEGAGAFPDPIAARVLWIGVRSMGDPEDLPALSRRVRGIAAHQGVAVEGRRFSPHLTVARRGGRGRGDPATPGARLVQALDTYRSEPFDVDRVSLIRSHLGQGPNRSPRYESAAVVPLRG